MPITLIRLKKSKDLSQNTSVECIPYHTVKNFFKSLLSVEKKREVHYYICLEKAGLSTLIYPVFLYGMNEAVICILSLIVP